jgi:hypothetical protein
MTAIDPGAEVLRVGGDGLAFAHQIRRRLPKAGDKWYLVVIKIAGTTLWLWRAVDQHGIVLDVLVQSRRDASAADRPRRRKISAYPASVDFQARDLPAVENERITKLRRASREITGGQGRDDRLAVHLGDVGDLDRDAVLPGRLLYPPSNLAPPRAGFAFQGPTFA